MSTIKEVVERGTQALNKTAASSARLDATVLLSAVLGIERAMLYAYPEREVSVEQEERFARLIERRKQHEPVAYLTGHKEFYGLDLLVDKRVLIPRPETELLVDAALSVIRTRLAAGEVPRVADIGTGSGAIPIALAVQELRLPYLYGCDISSDALELARLNAQRHGVQDRLRLIQGDLLAPLPEPVDLLIANLPYIGTEEKESLSPDVHLYEPSLALFSGPDGMELLRRFWVEVRDYHVLRAHSVVLLEIGYRQREELTNLIAELWPRALVTSHKDYAGWDRLLQIEIPPS